MPPSRQEEVVLSLSSEERRLHDLVLDTTKREIDSLNSKRDVSRRNNKLFTAVIKMRMLCNAGTFSSVEDTEAPLLHLEAECERCRATDEDSLMLLDDCSFCPGCGRPLDLSCATPGSTDSQGSDSDDRIDDISMAFDEVEHVLVTQEHPVPLSGFSTKLSAVVQNVARSGPEDKR